MYTLTKVTKSFKSFREANAYADSLRTIHRIAMVGSEEDHGYARTR